MIDLRCGRAEDILRTLPDASVDAVVTDPPYALTAKQGGAHGFMGASWDNGMVAHDPAFWAEVLRVAKPGAFLLAFGGTRTYHRLACAIEDAGWELRDMLNWLQGSGFPKSKSCLKPSHEPILLAKAPGPLQPLQIDACRLPTEVGDETGRPKGSHGAFPFSDDAWGNGPLTYAGGHTGGRWPPNTLFSHHPDCRPDGVRRVPASRGGVGGRRGSDTCYAQDAYTQAYARTERPSYADADGYESAPAWTCVDGCPIKALDEQAGPRTSGGYPPEGAPRSRVATYGQPNERGEQRFTSSTGSASRFFPTFGPDPQDAVPFRYVSKASRAERNAGCDGLASARPDAHNLSSNACATCGRRVKANGSGEKCECGPARVTIKLPPAANGHPTVKPLTLMSWLVRLIARPGAAVLDPFCGSGSTGVACVREGFGFIGIEMSEEYAAIARARIRHAEHEASAARGAPRRLLRSRQSQNGCDTTGTALQGSLFDDGDSADTERRDARSVAQ